MKYSVSQKGTPQRVYVKLNKQTPEMAQAKQGHTEASSPYERTFLQEMQKLGLNPIPNYAVDTFNADFGFPDIKLAVEVDGGSWHQESYESILADGKKEATLANQGWVVLRYPCTKKNQFLIPIWCLEIASAVRRLTSNSII